MSVGVHTFLRIVIPVINSEPTQCPVKDIFTKQKQIVWSLFRTLHTQCLCICLIYTYICMHMSCYIKYAQTYLFIYFAL